MDQKSAKFGANFGIFVDLSSNSGQISGHFWGLANFRGSRSAYPAVASSYRTCPSVTRCYKGVGSDLSKNGGNRSFSIEGRACLILHVFCAKNMHMYLKWGWGLRPLVVFLAKTDR